MPKDLPEEEKMWKEKLALEETKDESEDPFVPAKESKMDADNALVHVEL
jgi:hypothetical protein